MQEPKLEQSQIVSLPRKRRIRTEYNAQYYQKHKGKIKENHLQWRQAHREEIKKWRKKNATKVRVHHIMSNNKEKYPLCSTCELCECTNDLLRHHPDYDYPEIYVTCCPKCHSWIHKLES